MKANIGFIAQSSLEVVEMGKDAIQETKNIENVIKVFCTYVRVEDEHKMKSLSIHWDDSGDKEPNVNENDRRQLYNCMHVKTVYTRQ